MIEKLTESTVYSYKKSPDTESFIENMKELARTKDFGFDEDSHKYILDGNELLSVTTAMKPLTDCVYGKSNKDVLKKAADRGTAVHEAIEFYMKEEILEYGAEEKPYVDAFLKFEEDFHPEFLLSEVRIYNPEYQYAGTCDLIMVLNGEVVLIDVKTTYELHDMLVKIQLEAYKRALVAFGLKVKRKAVLQLKQNGSYKMVWYEDDDPDAWDVFKSCLSVSEYVRENTKDDMIESFFMKKGNSNSLYKEVPIPSVSSVVSPLISSVKTSVTDELLEESIRAEKEVKEAVFLYAEEEFMEIDNKLQGYADAFIRFTNDKKPKYCFTEKEVLELRHLYGENADMLAMFDGEMYLIYVTTSDAFPSFLASVYLEGIARGFDSMNFNVTKNAVLRLSENGEYSLDIYDRDPIKDWAMFVDLLVIERYRRRSFKG